MYLILKIFKQNCNLPIFLLSGKFFSSKTLPRRLKCRQCLLVESRQYFGVTVVSF